MSLFYNVNGSLLDNMESLGNIIKHIDAEIDRKKLERQCVFNSYYETLNNLMIFPYLVDNGFYRGVIAYLDNKNTGMKIKKEAYMDDMSAKECYEYLLSKLQGYMPYITEIVDYVICGYNMYAVEFMFHVEGSDKLFDIYIPIIKNIIVENVMSSTNYINYDVAKLQIYEVNGCSHERLWCGYTMDGYEDKIKEVIYR